MIKLKFNDDFKKLLDVFYDISIKIDEYPLIIGGCIRNLIYYNGILKDGDVDVVLGKYKNKLFIQHLINDYGAKDYNVYGNTETEKIKLGPFTIEFQSDTNEFVHQEIDEELDRLEIEKTWLNKNIYERDFSINTMFYDVRNKKVVDLTGKAYEDLLVNKILRCNIDPAVSFHNSPLNIVRAIKFSIQFGLEIDSSIIENAKNFKDAFVGRMVIRRNYNFIKGYINKTFSMDFEKTYNFYKSIDFMDIIPLTEEVQKQVNLKEVGLGSMKKIISSSVKNDPDPLEISMYETNFRKEQYKHRKDKGRKRKTLKTYKWIELLKQMIGQEKVL